MKTTTAELKRQAREVLTGRYGIAVGGYAVVFAISMAISMIIMFTAGEDITGYILTSVGNILAALLLSIMVVGLEFVYMNISRGREVAINQILYGFSNRPGVIIGIVAIMIVIGIPCYLPGTIAMAVGNITGSFGILAVGILLYIAGIIGYVVIIFSYAMAFYIYLDSPEKGVFQVLRESREMMRGNKGRYFYLQISFMGLVLLAVLSCGIGMLWLGPYMSVTNIRFYDGIRMNGGEKTYYYEEQNQ